MAAKARREPPGKRKGAMGDFLGELQKEQAQREERYKDRIAGEFFEAVQRVEVWSQLKTFRPRRVLGI